MASVIIFSMKKNPKNFILVFASISIVVFLLFYYLNQQKYIIIEEPVNLSEELISEGLAISSAPGSEKKEEVFKEFDLKAGNKYHFSIKVNNINNDLASIFLKIKFNPEIVTIGDFKEGSLFNIYDRTIEYNHSVDNRDGTMIIGIERYRKIDFSESFGTIAEMNFFIKSEGESYIEFIEPSFFDFDGNPINISLKNIKIRGN